MINLQDFIGKANVFRKFEVDELLFVEFQCPMEEGATGLWWQNNFFAYVLRGETWIKTPREEYTLRPDSCVFARKGSVISRSRLDEDFCEILIFVPDDFIRAVVQKYEIPLFEDPQPQQKDTVIPLSADEVLSSYFYSLLSFFHQEQPPATALLKLKFEELIVNVLSNANHRALRDYFREVCSTTRPSVREIMEANFSQNLSLSEFARLCARSLSSFKLEFKSIFNTTPGRWLTRKRLEYSRYLLETSDQPLDDIAFISGFKNTSHFIKVFREKFGPTPGQYRQHGLKMLSGS